MSAIATPGKRTRRRFLLGGLGAVGVLVVGWGLLPPRQRVVGRIAPAHRDGALMFNGWVALAPDGIVTVTMARSEMGQGVHTALPMLVAEEMDVPLAQVRLIAAPQDKIYGNVAVFTDALPFHPDQQGVLKSSARWMVSKVARELGSSFTGGSSSVKDAWVPMREAGATARAMLIAAAAEEWRVGTASCHTEAGFVVGADGRRASYGALAAIAARTSVDASVVRVKQPGQFTLIGNPAPRRDAWSKVDGSALYGIDVRLPGMLYAAVKMAPVLGASVASYDGTRIAALPGVLRVVDVSAVLHPKMGAGAGVAVVATSFWRAHQAVAALDVKWHEGAHAALSVESIFSQFATGLDTDAGYVYHERGQPDADQGAVKTVDAVYRAPFLAHAAMEPINCTAQVRDGKVTLWASTQVPSLAVAMAAKVAGVAAEDVHINVTLLGGGFGRRLEVDMVAQAVAIANVCDGAAVQLIWTREDDMTHDVYRPAALARFSASLDAHGGVLSYRNKSVSASIAHQYLPRSLGLPGGGPDKTTAEGEYDMQYEIAHQRIAHVIVDSAVPVGYWRSVGHSHNAFFKESFIDELAHAAGQDDVTFRRALLREHPRQRAVLDAVVARAGVAPPGRAHGVALHQSFGSMVAQVAEVSVSGRQIRVHRVVCAIDCGIAVNPNIIAQQMESAVIFGLSAALFGAITVKDGRIAQTNFHDYPVLRMEQAPQVETVIVASTQAPEGVGEPGTPPIAPAVANAVFKLTGQRLRSLPLTLA